MTPVASSGLECSFALSLDLDPARAGVSSTRLLLARAEPQSSRPPAPRGGRWVSLVARKSRFRGHPHPPTQIAIAAAQRAASPPAPRDRLTRGCRASLGALSREKLRLVPVGELCGEWEGGLLSEFQRATRRPSDLPAERAVARSGAPPERAYSRAGPLPTPRAARAKRQSSENYSVSPPSSNLPRA